MKKRFSEEQIIKILEAADSGLKIEELCRRHGISQATYYNWKNKYGGMTVSEAKRLHELEAENGKLKKHVAELSLDIVALNDIVSRKW